MLLNAKNLLRLNLYTLLCLIISSLLIAQIITAIYKLTTNVFSINLWISAAVINAIFALIIWSWPHKKAQSTTKNLLSPRWHLPGTIIIVGSLFLSVLTAIFMPTAQRLTVSYEQWWWISIIPLVEEIVFRVGVGKMLRHIGGIFWGSYFSALTFALAHNPDLNFWTLQGLALPLGPFLLGLCCEFFWVYSQSIKASVFFHMACNSSVVIFTWIDARWLQWLTLLYN